MDNNMISNTNRKNEVENSLSVHHTDMAYWEKNFLNYRLFLRFRGKHPYSIYRLHVTNVTVWL